MERLGYQPDIITSAKGLTSGYALLGAMLVSDRLAEPFADTDEQFLHGYTFAGHPVSCAVALANLDLFERQDFLGNVMANETYSGLRSTISAISRSSETSAHGLLLWHRVGQGS